MNNQIIAVIVALVAVTTIGVLISQTSEPMQQQEKSYTMPEVVEEIDTRNIVSHEYVAPTKYVYEPERWEKQSTWKANYAIDNMPTGYCDVNCYAEKTINEMDYYADMYYAGDISYDQYMNLATQAGMDNSYAYADQEMKR